MRKINKQPKTDKPDKAKEWPAVVYVWTIGMAIPGYIVGEIVLNSLYPHPIHWMVALGGVILGFCIGWVWYWIRGDINIF